MIVSLSLSLSRTLISSRFFRLLCWELFSPPVADLFFFLVFLLVKIFSCGDSNDRGGPHWTSLCCVTMRAPKLKPAHVVKTVQSEITPSPLPRLVFTPLSSPLCSCTVPMHILLLLLDDYFTALELDLHFLRVSSSKRQEPEHSDVTVNYSSPKTDRSTSGADFFLF